MAVPNMFVFIVVRGKCYLIFQLTITITVDLSVDNNKIISTADQVVERGNFGRAAVWLA